MLEMYDIPLRVDCSFRLHFRLQIHPSGIAVRRHTLTPGTATDRPPPETGHLNSTRKRRTEDNLKVDSAAMLPPAPEDEQAA